MHELGTIMYVIDTVENLARKEKLTVVDSITLQVGEVSGIIPQYLTDYWEYAKTKTEFLKETRLIIEELPAVTYCQDCKQTYPTVKYAKVCPNCSSTNTFLLTGNEYVIKQIEAM